MSSALILKGPHTAQQVLTLQTNDVRPLARLLRGIGFRHQAILRISNAGLEVAVEEVKTMSGEFGIMMARRALL